MPLVFKKVTEYDWDVTVQTPYKGKFKNCLLYTSPSPRDRG